MRRLIPDRAVLDPPRTALHPRPTPHCPQYQGLGRGRGVVGGDSRPRRAGIKQVRERAEEARERLAALKALTGEADRLEASDLDASEDVFITESAKCMVEINRKERSRETEIAVSEETDSVVELAELASDRLDAFAV